MLSTVRKILCCVMELFIIISMIKYILIEKDPVFLNMVVTFKEKAT